MTEGVRFRTVTLDSDGNVYAGGEFSEVGGVTANRIAMWDGQTWTAFNDGINGGPRQISYDPDTGDILVGGGFINVGNRVARWCGQSWSTFGEGVNAPVRNIFRHNGDIYIAGHFTESAGESLNRFARWDGQRWVDVGGGVNGPVYFMYPDSESDSIYLGGSFTQAGGWANTTGIVEWTGETWSTMGSGVVGGDDSPTAPWCHGMTMDDDGNLYVGGNFTEVDGVPAEWIAMWDGEQWHSLESGFDQPVYGISVGSDGKIYAGGYFRSAGDIENTDRIARWTGETWESVGGGLYDGPVRWIECHDDDVYVAGEFTYAGDIVVNKLAVFDVTWEPPALCGDRQYATAQEFTDVVPGWLLDPKE